MQLVRFDAAGLAIEVAPLPAGYSVTQDDGPVNDLGQRLALVDGAITRVWDLRGFSAFGGEDARQPTEIPDDPAFFGKSWGDLAKLGYHQVPRPETKQEAAARKAAEAEAAAAADRDRRANIVVNRYQLLSALHNVALFDKVAKLVADQDDRSITLAWDHAPDFKRSGAFFAWLVAALKLTEAQGDALAEAAEAIS